jgi:hypothetical protein
MSETGECRGDAAAYVLGALEPEEAERFRVHLASCVICRDEVAAFQPAVEALPMAAPAYPVSRALCRRVLGAVRADRSSAVGANTAPRPARSRFARARRQPALALGALAFAALVAVAALALSSAGSSGVRVVRATVTSPTGSAQLRLSGGHAELIVRDLPAPGAGRIYEVWLRRGPGAPSPTSALFGVTSSGAGDVGLPGNLHGVSEVLVTPEPLGGSSAPSSPAVIVARLT